MSSREALARELYIRLLEAEGGFSEGNFSDLNKKDRIEIQTAVAEVAIEAAKTFEDVYWSPEAPT